MTISKMDSATASILSAFVQKILKILAVALLGFEKSPIQRFFESWKIRFVRSFRNRNIPYTGTFRSFENQPTRSDFEGRNLACAGQISTSKSRSTRPRFRESKYILHGHISAFEIWACSTQISKGRNRGLLDLDVGISKSPLHKVISRKMTFADFGAKSVKCSGTLFLGIKRPKWLKNNT